LNVSTLNLEHRFRELYWYRLRATFLGHFGAMVNGTQSCASLQRLLFAIFGLIRLFFLDTENIWNGSTLIGSPYNLGNTSFVLNCMALVFLMSPGVGFLYSGLLRRRNALSALYLSMAAVAVVSIQVRPRGKLSKIRVEPRSISGLSWASP